jgi:hypothetical protein
LNDEKDMAKYKGKLSGKIVLLGAMRDVPVPDKPFFERYTDKDLKDLESLPVEGVTRICRRASTAMSSAQAYQ